MHFAQYFVNVNKKFLLFNLDCLSLYSPVLVVCIETNVKTFLIQPLLRQYKLSSNGCHLAFVHSTCFPADHTPTLTHHVSAVADAPLTLADPI